MTFEGDIDWKQMKEMFKSISVNREVLIHRGMKITAHRLEGLNLRKLSVPDDVNKLYRWMKQNEEQNIKVSNMSISLRKHGEDLGSCEWQLSISGDEKYYEASGNIIEEPQYCRFKGNSCGKLCRIFYRSFVKSGFDYEDIIADSRRPKDKGR